MKIKDKFDILLYKNERVLEELEMLKKITMYEDLINYYVVTFNLKTEEECLSFLLSNNKSDFEEWSKQLLKGFFTEKNKEKVKANINKMWKKKRLFENEK